MALADFYERAAVAASQVIAGFSPDLFRRILEQENVGLALGQQAAATNEGKSLAELSIRLLARLYPSIDLRAEVSSEGERLQGIARAINPQIEFRSGANVGIGIGSGSPSFDTTFFAGSDGWDALISTDEPIATGSSENPLGAGVSACFAVGSIFKHLLLPTLEEQIASRFCFSTYSCEKGKTPNNIPNSGWNLKHEAVLVGLGAIGNGAVWALGRAPSVGSVHIVDHESLELSNLQRYVLAGHSDAGRWKTDVADEHFSGDLTCISHRAKWAEFVQDYGYNWRQVLVALDSASDRRSVQAALPEWIANAWTQPGDLGVSVHDRFDGAGACLCCLYLPMDKAPNEDELVAAALSIPELVRDVRTLLHTGAPVGRQLLEAVAQRLDRPIEDVLPYEGRSIRELYVEGICGGRLIPLGKIGTPRQELHVQLAHQSALAGVLLAAALIRCSIETREAATTRITRIDVMGPLGEFLTQPTLKAQTGLCICEDDDYVRAYHAKFGT